MLKTYIVNEAIKNPNNYLNIDETINDLDNIHNNMNSEDNPEFILSILGNVFKIMELKHIYLRLKIKKLMILTYPQFNHLSLLERKKNMKYILILVKKKIIK